MTSTPKYVGIPLASILIVEYLILALLASFIEDVGMFLVFAVGLAIGVVWLIAASISTTKPVESSGLHVLVGLTLILLPGLWSIHLLFALAAFGMAYVARQNRKYLTA